MDKRYMTAVYEYDITQFPGNPFQAQTPFGNAKATGIGNAFEEIERLEREVERLQDLLCGRMEV